jgi:DNA gyrase subunit B
LKFIPVKEINKEAYKGKIYDLNVKNTHTYNINNIVVGNCSSGLHGVGVTCVNALADNFEVVVKRNGAIYKQTFSRGVPTSDVEQIGKTTETGTEIKYHPDKSIFKITLNPSEHVNNRLKELASLNPGIKIRYINDVDKTDTVYHFEDGITGYTMKMIEGKIKLYDNPFSFFGQYELPNGQLILCDIAFIHDDEAEPNTKIKSFANNVNTYEGGFHLQGFKNAYKDIINQYGIDKKLIKDPIEMKYLMDGMYCTISIKIPEAEFEGQTKTKLGNKEAQEAVEKIMHDFFDKEIKNKKLYDVFDSIINRASKVKEAEEAARKARSISRQTKKASKVALPGKLAECSNKNGYRELFLTEGDSAGGSAKEGRDRTYQSILPLRGKILNVNKADIGKILNSDTVKSIVASIGGGVGKTFSVDDVRYDKIIIMADADVDGNHIRSLILTLFYYYLPGLIESGRVYSAQPPLYRIIKSDNSSVYLLDDSELREYRQKHAKDKYTLNRFKGLGEMNPEQLGETTLDPKTRTLKRINLDEAKEVADTFEVLMGKNVLPRRQFIESNSDKIDIDNL